MHGGKKGKKQWSRLKGHTLRRVKMTSILGGKMRDKHGVLEPECVEQGVYERFGKWLRMGNSNTDRIKRASSQ